MTLIQSIILGAVQGITEFVPISSSGHLLVVQWLMGLNLSENAQKTFDVALHFGTLVALVIAVWPEVVGLLRSAWKIIRNRFHVETFDERLVLYIIISAIPAAVFGVLFESVVEKYLGAPLVIALELSLFGLVMLLVDRFARTDRALHDIKATDAWVIGGAQVLALIPGTSRSGITLTTGILRGLTREASVKFSFLISLPVIGGAVLYKGVKLASQPQLFHTIGAANFLVGIVASFIFGYIAIEWLLRYLRTRTLFIFVIYRFVVAALIILVVLFGWRPA